MPLARSVCLHTPSADPSGTGAHMLDLVAEDVGRGCEDRDGVRLARAVGCPAVVQTQHLPFLVSHPRKRQAFHHAVEEVAPLAGRTSREEARQILGVAPDQPVALTVGRLTHMKGQCHLIDALPDLAVRFPGLTVVLLGDGPLRASLQFRAATLGVSRHVVFAGHRPDARRLLAAADVFVLPSRHEGRFTRERMARETAEVHESVLADAEVAA